MYLILGEDYSFEYSGLQILSDDNSFHCRLGIHRFTLEKSYSFLEKPKYKLYSKESVSYDPLYLYNELTPIFRDFKIQNLLNK